MDSRIYGEGRINISLSSPAIIDLLGKIQIDRFYTNIKIASNTRINYIMVSFTNHYNAIFVGRFPSQTKIGKDSWYFNNSLLCKPEFSSTTNTFFTNNTKNNHPSASHWWENTKSCFKDVRTFSKNSRKY